MAWVLLITTIISKIPIPPGTLRRYIFFIKEKGERFIPGLIMQTGLMSRVCNSN